MMIDNLVINQGDIDRLWSKIAKGGESECWLWLAGTFSNGYGCFKVDHKSVLSHRIVFLLEGGALTSEEPYVLHSCDVKRCNNPKHLHAGSATSNYLEAATRSLIPSKHGQLNPAARLTEELVLEIKDRYRRLPYISQSSLARQYGISQQHISQIVNGTRWGSISQ